MLLFSEESEIFAGKASCKKVRFSLMLSLVTAGISSALVLLALPTAYALTRTRMLFKRLSEIPLELTMSLTYILLGLALLIVFSSPFGKWLTSHGCVSLGSRHPLV